MTLNQCDMAGICSVLQVVLTIFEIGNYDVVPVTFAQSGIRAMGQRFDERQLRKLAKPLEQFRACSVCRPGLPLEHHTMTEHRDFPRNFQIDLPTISL